jgi:hypothetical protein
MCFLMSDKYPIIIRHCMSNIPAEDMQARFKELVGGFKKLPRKFALLMPFKPKIEELLKLRASHDDIRLLLEDVNIVVSTDTVHRFCRKVIGQKVIRPYKPRPRKQSTSKVPPELPSSQKIETPLRERIPGPWSRRKPGPRIANSKNL